MDEKECLFREGFERRLSTSEEFIIGVDRRVVMLEKNTALDSQRFSMILENLSKLPEAMIDIKNSLLLMQEEIKRSGDKTESLENKLDVLDKKVCTINDENNFNIRLFLKDHIVGVIIGTCSLVAIGSFWLSNFVQNL